MKTPSSLEAAGRWIRAVGLLRLILFAVFLASWLFLYMRTSGRLMEASIFPVTLVLEILVLSLPWRTVSLRLVASFFLVGFGPVFYLTILSQKLLLRSPVHGWADDLSMWFDRIGVGYLGGLHATLWAPITEEVWKVAPLLLLFWWSRSGLRTQAGPLDLAVLGGATGAGMQFAEGIFSIGAHGAVSPVFGLGLGYPYIHLVVNPTTPSDWWAGSFDPTYENVMGFFIASVRQGDYGAVFAGHGVHPLAFGLALGLAVLGARRFKSRLVYLLPAFVLLWSIWEHFVANWYRCGPALFDFSRASNPNLLCLLSRLDLQGRIFPVVVAAGWILATVVSHRVLRRHEDRETALSWQGLGGLLGLIALVKDHLALLRLRRKTAYGFFHFEASPEIDQKRQTPSLLATRGQAYLLAMRLKGKSGPEMTPESQQALDRATPFA